ncbi:MAG: response regulator, partial [Thermodesulfobacteriota bacterium]
NLVARVLCGFGYRVLQAENGKDALRICGEHQGEIHLLVTDMVMPGMSGRELAQEAARLRPDMKVLYMSGYADQSIGRHGVPDADFLLLQKPFTPGAVARKVREMLDSPG